MNSGSAATSIPTRAAPLPVHPGLPLLVAVLSMMGPLCIDTYLPSFLEMERSLRATPLEVQQSLTAFLLPFAFMSLWHGSISDALGRRRPILVAISILSVSSLGCALSTNIQTLWFFRLVQGLSAGVFVIGRAVVRDVYEGAAAQRVMSHISVLFALAPAIAPVLGGQLHEWSGWRSVFLFLAGFTALLAFWCFVALPETHPPALRHPLHPGRLWRGYFESFTHAGFVAAAFAAALSFAAIFLYISSAPVLLLRHLHVRETQFFWLFGPVTAGMMLGGWLSGRLAGRLSPRQTLLWSYATMLLATLGNILFHAVHAAMLPWSVAPLFFYAAGMACSLPTLTLLGLEFFPARRGLASSCQAFVLTAGNAVAAGLLSPLASATPLLLASVSGALLGLSLLCLPFLGIKRERSGPSGLA